MARKSLTPDGCANRFSVVPALVLFFDSVRDQRSPLKEAPVRPKVLVTRRIFDEALNLLNRHFDVEANQRDIPVTPNQLVKRLQGKAGAVTLLACEFSDRVLA